jgi:hypothetical protein
MNTTVQTETIIRETAMDLAVQRLVAALNNGYLPMPRAFRADLGIVVVEVRHVDHLTDWRVFCNARHVALDRKTVLDTATNLWITRRSFRTAWNDVEHDFGFTCPAGSTCTVCGERTQGARCESCKPLVVTAR